MAKDADLLEEALEIFERCRDAESDNRATALDDLKFARLGEQWPEAIKKLRGQDRPCLTINKMPAFIRQVVNDARQNKPSIKVRPVDSGADKATADIMSGLIRHIEQSSSADVAYDTAADFAVSMGFGYIKVGVEYAHDETFDREIRIERVANPFAVFGDPYSTEADSSDWNNAFITEWMDKDEFERRYGDKDLVSFEDAGYAGLTGTPWISDDGLMLAEWWRREEEPRKIILLSNGMVVREKQWLDPRFSGPFEMIGIRQVNERVVTGYKITQRLMTGAQVLETETWEGRYIPIIPVYGDEINVEGKRYFHSLIAHAKDPQRMHNYWRSTTTEMIALQPKAPYIGEQGAFAIDPHKWETANTENHAYLEYAQGKAPPQRQPFAGVPAGALQEALNANDDMKAIIGIYDASLGAKSNETSGRAIIARQREGDVSTFHFIDNLSRAIRHTGRVIIDLIPHVYTGERMIRVLGEDGTADNVQIGPRNGEMPDGGWQIYDLSVGKYDLAVEAGPGYTTRRQEAAEQMMELLRVFPQAAPVVGDLLVKNLDWPQADEIAERLKAMLPPGAGQDDPRLAEAVKIIKDLQQKLQAATGQVKDKTVENKIKAFEAETKRLKVVADVADDMRQDGRARTEQAGMAGTLPAA